MLTLILLVFAFVLFVTAAFLQPTAEPWKGRLCCLGLACLALADILRNSSLLH